MKFLNVFLLLSFLSTIGLGQIVQNQNKKQATQSIYSNNIKNSNECLNKLNRQSYPYCHCLDGFIEINGYCLSINKYQQSKIKIRRSLVTSEQDLLIILIIVCVIVGLGIISLVIGYMLIKQRNQKKLQLNTCQINQITKNCDKEKEESIYEVKPSAVTIENKEYVKNDTYEDDDLNQNSKKNTYMTNKKSSLLALEIEKRKSEDLPTQDQFYDLKSSEFKSIISLGRNSQADQNDQINKIVDQYQQEENTESKKSPQKGRGYIRYESKITLGELSNHTHGHGVADYYKQVQNSKRSTKSYQMYNK